MGRQERGRDSEVIPLHDGVLACEYSWGVRDGSQENSGLTPACRGLMVPIYLYLLADELVYPAHQPRFSLGEIRRGLLKLCCIIMEYGHHCLYLISMGRFYLSAIE